MKQPVTSWCLALSLPPQAQAVVNARRTFLAFLKELSFSARAVRELTLAVTEALNNAIEHQHTRKAYPIELEARLLEEGALWIGIRGHSGKQGAKHLQRALNQAELQDMDEERGRGLFLMKSMMDEVGVRSLSQGRTEFWMLKRL